VIVVDSRAAEQAARPAF